MASLGTGFGPLVHAPCLRTQNGDLIAPQLLQAVAPPPIPINKAAEVAAALFEGFFDKGEPILPVLPLESIELEEACRLSGLRPRTIRNLLHAKDPLLLAARLPGKGYRFNRVRFLKWIEERPDYARLPGVKKARRKKANRKA